MPVAYDGPQIIVSLDHRFVLEFLKVLSPEANIALEIENGETAVVFHADDGALWLRRHAAEPRSIRHGRSQCMASTAMTMPVTTIKDDSMPPTMTTNATSTTTTAASKSAFRRPSRCATCISQLLAKRGYAQVQTAADLRGRLARSGRREAGRRHAAGQRPARRAGSARPQFVVSLQELAFVKAKVVKTLAKLVPEQQIRDVRFRVGALD